MTNGFRGLLVGGGEPIYVKLKEVEKLAVRHFKVGSFFNFYEPDNLYNINFLSATTKSLALHLNP